MNEQESLDFSHGNPTLRQLLGSALSNEKDKKNEEDTILDFVFESDFLKMLFKGRCKDIGETISIDNARMFLSEFKTRLVLFGAGPGAEILAVNQIVSDAVSQIE